MTDARQIAALMPMPRLLEALGFEVNERTRRAPCPLHQGRNPSAFSWTEDGRWYCFSCGAGGDRIELVRAVRQCSFREAVEFLARLAGVEYRARRISGAELEEARRRRERAEAAAWHIRDEVLRLRCYYRGELHRSERLWRRLGDELLRARTEAERESAWNRMARLAPACTFFLAAFDFLNRADRATLARFALSAERRALILGDTHENAELQAA